MSKSVVSAETARELKEKGFTPPEPADGQKWYSTFDTAFEITVDETGKNILTKEEERPTIIGKNFNELYSYAPDADDIKKEIKALGASVYHLPDDPEVCAADWLNWILNPG